MSKEEQDPFVQFILRHPALGQKVMVLNRAGQELLDAGRVEEAEGKFHAALKICECAIPALNNLALCAQARGDLPLAVRTANRVLEYLPGNIFAHCTLAECYAEQGKMAQAARYMESALHHAAAADPSVDKLEKVMEALAALEWDDQLYHLYLEYRDLPELEAELDDTTWFYIGVALANHSDDVAALVAWDKASHTVELALLYSECLSLVREGKAPRFRFPYRLIEPDAAMVTIEEFGDAAKPLLITAVWDKNDEQMQTNAITVLQELEDPWAESFLRLLLVQPELSDDLKQQAISALVGRGALAPGDKVEVHLGGKRRWVTTTGFEAASSLSTEAVRELNRGMSTLEEGRADEAEAAFRKALEILPGVGPAAIALANLLRDTGREQEAERTVQQAIEADDDPVVLLYLAQFQLERNRFEDARRTLSRVSRADLEDSLLVVYHLIAAQIELQFGNIPALREHIQELLGLTPDRAEVEALVKWLRVRSPWGDYDERLRRKRRQRYLNRCVSSRMGLLDALGTLTKDNLIAMAKAHGIRCGTLRKREIQRKVSEYIPAHLEDIVARLAAEERGTLRRVIEEGGSCELSHITAREDEIEFEWRYREPTTSLGRLQSLGLLVVGSEDGVQIAFIPPELRSRIKGALG